MTRLLHLTDLHFGLHRVELVEPLRAAILANQPDLVVVSGDLTHRARAGQFRAAMQFLNGLGLPLMIIPGNHDMPLFNPFARFLSPFGRYRRAVGRDLTPQVALGAVRLFGVNTADPQQWRGGVARKEEIERVCQAVRAGPDGGLNILVAHHPFAEPPGFERGETAGAQIATEKLAAAGLNVILSGHLHHWTVGLGIDATSVRPVLHIQTGTALCSRIGEKNHGFAVIDASVGQIAVTPWVIDEARTVFAPQARVAFQGVDGLWQRVALA
ncbi:phosphodiesterase [Cypionkella aquatica]|uniref:Phosphodiesterase n=1 Tax=Cypionkella aquatica TaxID=1756042 RepID=A0AA37TRD3_9RHOB|nr:metallophosphoesterase [Cypionkella aquatica]GLS86212.1 phosphodiesterase [Cypionkella aquatica]